jgi:hypothetical protein
MRVWKRTMCTAPLPTEIPRPRIGFHGPVPHLSLPQGAIDAFVSDCMLPSATDLDQVSGHREREAAGAALLWPAVSAARRTHAAAVACIPLGAHPPHVSRAARLPWACETPHAPHHALKSAAPRMACGCCPSTHPRALCAHRPSTS